MNESSEARELSFMLRPFDHAPYYSPMNEFAGLSDLINYHLRLHGGMELIDMYKLIHQSAFGPEHLIHSTEPHSTSEEMQSAGVEFVEPLMEPIALDTDACRINLRTAGKRGILPHIIDEAVRDSAGKFSRSQETLYRLWSEVGNSLGTLEKQFTQQDFNQLTQFLRKKGFPPVHHSPAYKRINRPAYRVLMREEFERLTPPLPVDSQ